MIQIKNLDFAYGKRQVLNKINCRLKKGELISIVGPNGAGKSTLLKLIAGLIAPTEGEITVLGLSPNQKNRGVLAKRMAHLSQHFSMTFPFRVIEVVLMGRYTHQQSRFSWTDKSSDKERAMRALEHCDVAHLQNRKIDELSGGEQRRVLVAQALCQEADILLFDEPTAGLDPRHARELFALLRHECDQGKSLLVVTHDLNLALRYSDKLLLLKQGSSLDFASVTNVLSTASLQKAFDTEFFQGTLPNTNAPFLVSY